MASTFWWRSPSAPTARSKAGWPPVNQVAFAPDAPDVGTRSGPRRGAVTWLAIATFVLGVARYIPIIDEPWGMDPGSGNGTWYSGQPVKNWQRLGFGATRGVPLLGALPTDPPLGTAYTHHPPLCMWIANAVVSAFGYSERVFRLFPIGASALAGALLVLLAASRMPKVGAAVTGLLWLVLPMSFLFGSMPNPEAPTVCLIVLTVLLHDRLRTARPARYGLVLLAQFVAGQLDWEAQFTIPALLVFEVLRPRGDRRLARVVVLGCVSLVSALVVATIHGFMLGVGQHAWELANTGAHGFAPVFSLSSVPHYLGVGLHNVFATTRETVVPGASMAVSAWLERQGRWSMELFTWPAALAAVAGAVVALVRRTPALVLGLTLAIPGVLNVVAFRVHASHHEYWQYYLTPGIALLTAGMAREVWGRSLARCVAAALLIVAVGVWSVARIQQRRAVWCTTTAKDVAAELDRVVPDGTILYCGLQFCPMSFYTRHWLFPSELSAEHFDTFRTIKESGALHDPALFLVLPFEGMPPAPEFEAELAKLGCVTRIDRGPLAARMPALARAVTSGPIWLVAID